MNNVSTDVLIIGSGPAGLLCAIMANQNRKVTVIEKPGKEFKLGKRILVSGNGRCNFFNEDLLTGENINKKYASYFPTQVADSFLSFLRENGFAYIKEGKLYYPFFKRSECFHSFLLSLCKNVDFVPALAMEVKNHQLIVLKDGQKVLYSFKDLVIATGGRSLDREDFSYQLLDSLKVKYYPFSSALCPVRVKEKIPSYLKNNRLHGLLKLFDDDRVLYEEEGEILFKEDGLSGICVFNSTIPLSEEIRKGNHHTLTYSFDYSHGLEKNVSFSCLPSFLKEYLKERKLQISDPLTFTFESLYPFKESQLSYGGVLLSEIEKESFSIQDNTFIHIIGELLDISLPCGGYNMGSALLEGYQLGLYLSNHDQ